MKDRELDKFVEDITNNTPHAKQFESVKIDDFEEDLLGGKSFKTVRKENKDKKKDENV